MKNAMLLTVLVIITTAALLTGCTTGNQPAPAASAPAVSQSGPALSQKEPDGGASTWLVRYKFKSADGAEALNIKRYSDHDKIELSCEGVSAVFKGRTDVPDRVKYKELAGEAGGEKQLVAEVKIKPDSIKLVDEKEALLWKVKFNDDKIKISNNEEGTNSYEIKLKDSAKGEIRDASGNEIGNVRFYPDNGKLKVKDAGGVEILISKDSQFSMGPGVILFKHIPIQHRAVIISEIMRRGR